MKESDRPARNEVRVLSCMLALLTLFLLSHASAEEIARADTEGLVLRLTAYGKTSMEQERQAPLLFQVVLKNANADFICAVNRQTSNRRKALNSELAKMSPEERSNFDRLNRVEPVPVINIGSERNPFTSQMQIELRDADGHEAKVNPKLLACDRSLHSTVKLDGQHNPTILFGLDPEALQSLPSNSYRCRAVLQQGAEKIESNEVQFSLTSSEKDDPIQWYQFGRYYLLDKQYERMIPYIERLQRANNPESVVLAAELDGWKKLGLNDVQASQKAFQKGMASFCEQERREMESNPSLRVDTAIHEGPEGLLMGLRALAKRSNPAAQK